MVSLILDHSQEAGRAEGAEVAKLVAAGVPLLVGTSPVHRQILHAKFTVVDSTAVEYGSWNYLLSGRQQSNDLHFSTSGGIAPPYLKDYDTIRPVIVLAQTAMEPASATPAA